MPRRSLRPAAIAKPKLLSVEDAKALDVARMTDLFKAHINPGQLHFMKLLGFHKVKVERAEGMFYFDQNGRKILDFFGGFGSLAFGHNHPRILEARRMQPGTMVTDPECQNSLIRGMLLYVIEGREASMSANGPSRHWRWFRGIAGTRPKAEVSKPKGLFCRFMSSPPRLIRLIWLIGSHRDEKVFEKKRFRATVWLAICMRIRLGAELVWRVLLQQVTKFDPGSDRKEQEP